MIVVGVVVVVELNSTAIHDRNLLSSRRQNHSIGEQLRDMFQCVFSIV
jgi:hypothetical protein